MEKSHEKISRQTFPTSEYIVSSSLFFYPLNRLQFLPLSSEFLEIFAWAATLYNAGCALWTWVGSSLQ